jgi:hypothetical protein
MPDFWPSCGYRLLRARADGRLAISEEFLRSYLLRPELAPLPESSTGELSLHQRMLDDPRREVSADEIAAIAYPDARENYRIWLRFRDRLGSGPDLESAYAGLFHGEGVDVPPPSFSSSPRFCCGIFWEWMPIRSRPARGRCCSGHRE